MAIDRARRHGGAGGAAEAGARAPAPGKRTRVEAGAAGAAAPAAGTASGGGAVLASPDARVGGRAPADVAGELRAMLVTDLRVTNEVVAGILATQRQMRRWRGDHALDVMADEARDDDRTDPRAFDFELERWERLRGELLAALTSPGDVAHVQALARMVVALELRRDQLLEGTANMRAAFGERLGEASAALGRTLAVVRTVRDVGFASAVAAAAIAAAPAGAVYGAFGEGGASVLGGALIGAGYRGSERDDDRPLADRMLLGAEEGALAATSMQAGQAVGGLVDDVVGGALTGTRAGAAVTSALAGGADAAVASGGYSAGDTLAQGGSAGDAVRAGLRAAAESAPFGAALGLAASGAGAGGVGPASAAATHAEIETVPRSGVAARLAEAEAAGATIRPAGADAAGARSYEVAYPDGRSVRIVEDAAAPVATAAPSAAQAAAARAAADRAAAIQAARDAELTALIRGEPGPIVADTVILGAGQSGTLAYASLRGPVGAAPGVRVDAIPEVFNVAPEGSMFARHGDFAIGQPAPELAAGAGARSVGELTADHAQPVAADDFVRSLALTGYDSGMVTYKATVERVEVRPAEGWGEGAPPEARDRPIRVSAGGKTIYVRRFVSAGGLGEPRPLARDPSSPLAAHEAELRRAGRLVFAQDALALPGGGQRVAVVGDGATGAWACEKAIAGGATKVYWIGSPQSAPSTVDAATRAELVRLGMDDAQIDTFGRAYNGRNAPTFRFVESGQVELHRGLTDAQLDPATQRVKVTLGDGAPVEVDGIIAATGQNLTLAPGLEKLSFKMVIVSYKGQPRVVALDAVDKLTGKPLGIRIEGAQMVKAAERLPKDDKALFDGYIRRQVNHESVPAGSRGVPGAIYQNNIDIPLASGMSPLEEGTGR